MPDFESYSDEAREIEQAIIRHGIALDIDWDDAATVHNLARQALDCHLSGTIPPECTMDDIRSRARIELFGLVQLMLKVMTESATEESALTHGGPVWKSFAHALWAEYRRRIQSPP